LAKKTRFPARFWVAQRFSAAITGLFVVGFSRWGQTAAAKNSFSAAC
jgi:hypothetical protein